MQERDDYYAEDNATFGDRIAAAREALGLTQDQLASRVGVRAVTLKNWENDRAEPRANKLQMLAGILNVSMVWLMTGAGDGVEPQLDDLAALASESATRDIIIEMREIREQSVQLTARLARLEKHLRATIN